MPLKIVLQYTPIKAPRGKLTHATSITEPGKTLCGIPHLGWRIVTDELDCPGCKIGAPRFREARREAKK